MDRLQQMAIGTPVVHQKYGVGRYQGLEIVQHHDQPEQPMGEFMVISYAEDSKVYVPIQSLEQISRYVGADAEHAPLHHLKKQKSASKIRDIAAELLALYRKRHQATGSVLNSPMQIIVLFLQAFHLKKLPTKPAPLMLSSMICVKRAVWIV